MANRTSVGEPLLEGLPICVPKILLPKSGVDLSKWACVACDQFESEPDYWAELDKAVGDAPSSLRIVFPEVFLSSVDENYTPADDTRRIDTICNTMTSYVESGLFQEHDPAFVAIDRKTPHVASRKGLIVAIDLEQYNYNCAVPTPIRPTEKTIVARLPPRIAIRERAQLECPHIIIVIDDPGKTVIEPLFSDACLTEEVYNVQLPQDSGAIKGLRLKDAGMQHVQKAMKTLADKEMAAAKAAAREPALLLIGDGNHSLATAKSCWEALKAKGNIPANHPQRYALVELQNLYDDGVVFEPIHRLLTGTTAEAVQSRLEEAWGCKATKYEEPVPQHSVVLVKGPGKADRVTLVPPEDRLPVVSMSDEVDALSAENKGLNISYVHGVSAVESACADRKTVGLLLPKLDKRRFLETIHAIGTLPRKAFSMGEADEKRFYIEARNILPAAVSRQARSKL